MSCTCYWHCIVCERRSSIKSFDVEIILEVFFLDRFLDEKRGVIKKGEVMKTQLIIGMLVGVFCICVSQCKAQPTYGNWSGVIRTQDVDVNPNNPNFAAYTPKIKEFLLKNYKGRYVALITYVVKKGARYTLSLKYPEDGIERSLQFIGYNPFASKGFHISYQVSKNPGTFLIRDINFSNSRASKFDRVVVVVSTSKPSVPFYLNIQYPAKPDTTVGAATVNPGNPRKGKQYYGTIVKTPLLLN